MFAWVQDSIPFVVTASLDGPAVWKALPANGILMTFINELASFVPGSAGEAQALRLPAIARKNKMYFFKKMLCLFQIYLFKPMKIKSMYLNMLLVGMSLGTAWAIRGQFGHEHGAAFAGSLGSLSVLLLVNRKDWLAQAFSITLAGALGWGLGGMMSYGLVVGYGRADDWTNVLYGLSMLFVIGGLYGFLGGGLFGLAICKVGKDDIPWVQVITEMVVGGAIMYFFLIEQFGWYMTPPRSEVWAICLGMALALLWIFLRLKLYAALRVAAFSGLGAGFGFAFGNFLQVLGQVSEIPFNFWNVMEYSLGFFGGLGLAYGTLTSEWAAEKEAPKGKQPFAIFMLLLLIPFVMWQQNFKWDRIQETYVKLIPTDDPNIYAWVQWGSLGLIACVAVFWCQRLWVKQQNYSFTTIWTYFFSMWALYILLSYLVTGAIISLYRPEQYLYALNFVLVFSMLSKASPMFDPKQISFRAWGKNLIFVLMIISFLAYLLTQSHGEMKGAHKRFGDLSSDTLKK